MTTKGRTYLGFPSSRLIGLGLIGRGQDPLPGAGAVKVKGRGDAYLGQMVAGSVG